MSSEDKITIIPRSDILIAGKHAAAGEPVEVDARTATDLLQGGFAERHAASATAAGGSLAARPPASPAGQETAANPLAGQQTATAASKPKPPKRTAPKAP